MRDTKRYWYFITEEDMGDKMSLTPRCPINMGDCEPRIKRICVAPTVAHCLSAINISGQHVHVYRTVRQVVGKKTYHVGDSHITKEHWLMDTTRFERVTTLTLPWHTGWANGSRGGTSPFYHDEQRKNKRAIMSSMRRRDVRLCNIEKANVRWKGEPYKAPPEVCESVGEKIIWPQLTQNFQYKALPLPSDTLFITLK